MIAFEEAFIVAAAIIIVIVRVITIVIATASAVNVTEALTIRY